MAKISVFIFSFLFLVCATSVWPEVKVVPNFSYYQELLDNNQLDKQIIKKLEKLVKIRPRNTMLNDQCRTGQIVLRLMLSEDTTIPASGLKIVIKNNVGQSRTVTTDLEGKAILRNLRISKFPLKISIPLIAYQKIISNPVERLNYHEITSRLDVCLDGSQLVADRPLYEALFSRLLIITRNDAMVQRVDFIITYYHEFLLTGCCWRIRSYLTGIEAYHYLQPRLFQQCPGIQDCLGM